MSKFLVMTLTQWKVYLQCSCFHICKNQTPNHWNYKKQKQLVHSQVMGLGLSFTIISNLLVHLFFFIYNSLILLYSSHRKCTLLSGVMLYISLRLLPESLSAPAHAGSLRPLLACFLSAWVKLQLYTLTTMLHYAPGQTGMTPVETNTSGFRCSFSITV